MVCTLIDDKCFWWGWWWSLCCFLAGFAQVKAIQTSSNCWFRKAKCLLQVLQPSLSSTSTSSPHNHQYYHQHHQHQQHQKLVVLSDTENCKNFCFLWNLLSYPIFTIGTVKSWSRSKSKIDLNLRYWITSSPLYSRLTYWPPHICWDLISYLLVADRCWDRMAGLGTCWSTLKYFLPSQHHPW